MIYEKNVNCIHTYGPNSLPNLLLSPPIHCSLLYTYNQYISLQKRYENVDNRLQLLRGWLNVLFHGIPFNSKFMSFMTE